ncbi:hypothetical protein VE23_13815 [Paenibacillus sp. D9]|uniref:zinc ribbon domain-containing protein n=1 Tax=Paenibacillus sp. D9 TaxID=665792 RepID=UPI00061E73B3|nr:zinc ribbon domain-containing protein [Paenibacillus sp. D9]KKC47938.1 hypothetical protein VE23_13815 [Paenibacillus sp. D9]
MSRETSEGERGRAVRTACPYCGFATMDDEASFCSRCGKPLHTAAILARRLERAEWLEKIKDVGAGSSAQPLQDREAQEIWNRMSRDGESGRKADGGGGQAERSRAERPAIAAEGAPATGYFRLWMLPAAALLISCLAVLAVFVHDGKVNAKVRSWHVQAEKEAKAGQYRNAEQLLELAAASRPGNPGIAKDIDIVRQAAKLDDDIKAAGLLLDQGSLEKAESGLRQAQATLSSRHEELFDPIRDKLAGAGARLAVQQVSSELDGLGTIREMAERLQRLRGLQAPGAPELRQRILDSMVQMGINQAQQLLRKKDFSAARAAVDETVSHAGNTSKLQEMSTRIDKEKEEYEEQERKRLNAAMQMANLEQRQNQTDAFDIVELNASIGEEGSAVITGLLKSKATRGIRAIRLFYVLKDAEGVQVGSGTISVSSGGVIEPGGSAAFTEKNASVKSEASVAITSATWYID